MQMIHRRCRSFAVLLLAGMMGGAYAATPDLDAEWRDFLANADLQKVYKVYGVAGELNPGDGDIDADACREHGATLAEARQSIPVSAAVHYFSYRCAEALGDEAEAERHAERFAAIAKHALAGASDDWNDRPIRVVGGHDIYTILRASGLQVRYEWLDPFAQRRYMTVRIAAWDEQARRERHFAFDYVDVVISLSRAEERAQYPAYRSDYGRFVVGNMARGDVVMGIDLQAVFDASRLTRPQERVDVLRPAVEHGGFQSATVWLDICRQHRFEGCGESLVDALLPFAEKEWGLPVVLLGLAYMDGIGVAKDEGAAMQLLEKAGAVMGRSRAVLTFAREFNGGGTRPFPDVLRAQLRGLAAEGDSLAAAVLAINASQLTEDGLVSDAELEALRPHAPGSTTAARQLGIQLFYRDRFDEAAPHVVLAAKAGDSLSQDLYARMLHDGAGVDADIPAANEWWRRAAQGGDNEAMRSMAILAKRDKDWPRAETWYENAIRFGNEQATIDLAQLYSDGHEGLKGDASRGVALLTEQDTPDARQMLSYLYLEGRGVDKDPAKAEALLREDAERGNLFSSMMLGLGWLEGNFGKVDTAQGMRWLAKGLEAGDSDTVDGYATHLYYQKGDPASRTEAIALWRKNQARHPDAGNGNNLAWILCTSPDPSTQAPAEGLAVAKTLGKPESLPYGVMDTVAACHAATGDFAEAERLQALVVSTAQQDGADDEDLAGLRGRLALFRKRQAYLEDKPAP